MKLVTFGRGSQGATHEPRVGALHEEDRVLTDLTEHGVATSMLELIEGYRSKRAAIEKAIQSSVGKIDVANVEILAPIPRPRRNILCVGKNYHEHAKEFGRSGFDGGSTGGDETPAHPIIFTKMPSAVIGPGEPIESALDPFNSVDYEAELAVVIGKYGRVLERDDPMSFVFGYTIMNDVTSRQGQKLHKQWLLGKSIDTFAPLGPVIATADSIPDLGALTIELRVNGERRQAACIRDLIFDIPTLIRVIGRSITLEPGDIIATGTPAGVGIGFEPPRYLKAGDMVRIDVSGIGTLENPVH
ncbi:fumarylacetoacetate hydrolase family protein [Bradyrhizobium diazoefficiens]|uniref:fumarylacetoacetate hydrolase family protein n=1 Tax=Bradyrhizobium diazoefficiens TaxID=1355477 RepID=UPI0035169C1D